MNSQYQQNVDSQASLQVGSGESVSACMDGELSLTQRDDLLGLFKLSAGGADLKAQWNLYHCIGDAMRSEELAGRPDGFQLRFAEKLAAEPHIFAPDAMASNVARARRRGWLKPVSLVASFAAVAVVAGVVTQQFRGSGDGPLATAALVPASLTMPASQQPVVGSSNSGGFVVPSAYLAAHNQYASGLAMQGMAVHVRNVTHDGGN